MWYPPINNTLGHHRILYFLQEEQRRAKLFYSSSAEININLESLFQLTSANFTLNNKIPKETSNRSIVWLVDDATFEVFLTTSSHVKLSVADISSDIK